MWMTLLLQLLILACTLYFENNWTSCKLISTVIPNDTLNAAVIVPLSRWHRQGRVNSVWGIPIWLEGNPTAFDLMLVCSYLIHLPLQVVLVYCTTMKSCIWAIECCIQRLGNSGECCVTDWEVYNSIVTTCIVNSSRPIKLLHSGTTYRSRPAFSLLHCITF